MAGDRTPQTNDQYDDPVRQLAASVAGVVPQAPGDLPDASLAELLVDLDRVQNQLDAQRLTILDVWDKRSVWSFDGARSGASWLATHTELSRAAAASDIKLTRALRNLPTTRKNFASGDLGVAKVRLLAATARLAPEAFVRDEDTLVAQAIALTVDQVRRLLAFWLARANPESDDQRDERRHEERKVHLSQTFQNGWRLDGDLPDEYGEVLNNAIERWEHKLYEAERASCATTGDLPTTTAAQRRADALLEIAKQAMLNDDGVPMNVPSITGIIDITRLIDLDGTADETTATSKADQPDDPCITVDATSGEATGPTETHLPDLTRSDTSTRRSTDLLPRSVSGPPVGETEQGIPISPETALRYLCACHFSRIITGPDSAPIDLGLTARLASPAQRRALAARDNGCTFPGCDRPHNWTKAHHIVHWTRDGPTDLANLTSLCNFHHHRVHEGGFGCARGPDNTVIFTRPDGTPITVTKARLDPMSL